MRMSDAAVPDVIFLATTPWDGAPLTERHLAAGLAPSRRVLYVEPPVGPGATGWRAAGRARRVHAGVDVLTPRALPCPDRSAGWPWSRHTVARQIRRARDRAGMRSPLLVDFALRFDVAGLVGERATVAYLKDGCATAAARMGVPAARLRSSADRALARAALVVTPSRELAAEAVGRTGGEILELPPGCDALRPPGAPDPAILAVPGPRIGLVGALDARIDWDLVGGVAGLRPDWSFVLVGPRPQRSDAAAERALAHANVHELGRRAAHDVPSVLSALDAAIVPFRVDDAAAVRSTPLRTLEFLAAGLPVVATPIPAHRRLAPSVRLAGDVATTALALTDELARDDRDRRAARRRFAAANDWSHRCEVLDVALRDVWTGAG